MKERIRNAYGKEVLAVFREAKSAGLLTEEKEALLKMLDRGHEDYNASMGPVEELEKAYCELGLNRDEAVRRVASAAFRHGAATALAYRSERIGGRLSKGDADDLCRCLRRGIPSNVNDPWHKLDELGLLERLVHLLLESE